MMEQTPEELVMDFIKKETFYLMVLLFVVIVVGTQTYHLFKHSEDLATDVQTLGHDSDQNRLKKMETRWAALDVGNPLVPPFAGAVKQLERMVLAIGGVIIVLAALAWIVRGRLLQGHELRLPAWGLWDVLKTAGMLAAGGLLFGLIFKSYDPEAKETSHALAQIFSGILAVGVMIHVVLVERGGRLRDLGFRRGGLRQSIALGILGVLFVMPFLALFHYVGPEITIQQPLHTLLFTRSKTTLALAGVSAIIVAPIAEELLFRGLLLPALQRWMNRTAAIVLSALFFAAGHIDLFVFLPMLALGLVMGYLYDRTRSIAAPLAMHMTYNGLVILGVFARRTLL